MVAVSFPPKSSLLLLHSSVTFTPVGFITSGKEEAQIAVSEESAYVSKLCGDLSPQQTLVTSKRLQLAWLKCRIVPLLHTKTSHFFPIANHKATSEHIHHQWAHVVFHVSL